MTRLRKMMLEVLEDRNYSARPSALVLDCGGGCHSNALYPAFVLRTRATPVFVDVCHL